MTEKKFQPFRTSTLFLLALRSLLLIVVIPAGVIIYLFRDRLEGTTAIIGILLLLLSVIGFYVLWSVIRSVIKIHDDLKLIAEGKATSVELDGSNAQLNEMSQIINKLNQLTVEFRENSTQLENFIHQFATLSELTEITASVPDIDELLQIVLEKSMDSTSARRGSVMLVDDSGEKICVVTAAGWDLDRREPINLTDSIVANVIETGKPMRVENIETADIPITVNNAERYTSSSFIIMPLKAKSSTIGVVCLSNKAAGAVFGPQDQQFLSVLLAQVGFAVENARLLMQARDSAQQLQRTVRDRDVQLYHAEQKFSEVEKLSAIGRLAGGVAHDFNNILQTIQGYLQLAMEGMDPDDIKYQDLEHVMKASKRADKLITQLLAFGRRQSLKPIDMDLNRVIDDMIEMLKPTIGEHIELKVIPETELGAIRADPAQMEQILMNLCLNARDAMPDGGRITINTANVKADDGFCNRYPLAEPGMDYVQVEVADTGCGMDETTREKAFEPFFTTKDVGKGVGLGLASVYGIVKQHNGIIDIESAPGEGTRFWIHLPAIDRPAVEFQRETPEKPRGGNETILVAEDDAEIAELAKRILVQAGYTVLTAADGEEALRVYEEDPGRVDFALLDIIMPNMNGDDVRRKIHETRPELPVLFSSGYSSNTLSSDINLGETYRKIAKPYDPAELLGTIREMLDGIEAPTSHR